MVPDENVFDSSRSEPIERGRPSILQTKQSAAAPQSFALDSPPPRSSKRDGCAWDSAVVAANGNTAAVTVAIKAMPSTVQYANVFEKWNPIADTLIAQPLRHLCGPALIANLRAMLPRSFDNSHDPSLP